MTLSIFTVEREDLIRVSLGAIALLIPGLPKLKEWAYAGFTFVQPDDLDVDKSAFHQLRPESWF